MSNWTISEPNLHSLWHRKLASWGSFMEDAANSVWRAPVVSYSEKCFLLLSYQVFTSASKVQIYWWKIPHMFIVKGFAKGVRNLTLAMHLTRSSNLYSAVPSRTNILQLFIKHAEVYYDACWQKTGVVQSIINEVFGLQMLCTRIGLVPTRSSSVPKIKAILINKPC